MKQILLYSSALLVIVFQTMSCGKKSSPAPVCKIVNAVDNDPTNPETINITYNDDGKISTLSDVTSTSTIQKVFTYAGNVIEVVASGYASGIVQDSIAVNSDGLMTVDATYSAGNVTRTTYNYSGTQVVSSVSETNNGTPSTTTYSFSNGDLTSVNGSPVGYNDKPSLPGDYIQFFQLLQNGVPYIKCAHQCISVGTGSGIENFNYTYDNTGKITQLVGTYGTSVTTYNYSYECN